MFEQVKKPTFSRPGGGPDVEAEELVAPDASEALEMIEKVEVDEVQLKKRLLEMVFDRCRC